MGNPKDGHNNKSQKNQSEKSEVIVHQNSTTGAIHYENTDKLLNSKDSKSIVEAAKKWYDSEHYNSYKKPTKEETKEGALPDTYKSIKDGFNQYKNDILSQELADVEGNQTGLNALKDKYKNLAAYNDKLNHFAKDHNVNIKAIDHTINNISSTTDAGKIFTKNYPNTLQQQKDIYAEDKQNGSQRNHIKTEAILLENKMAIVNSAILDNATVQPDGKTIKLKGYAESFPIQTNDEALKSGNPRKFGLFDKTHLTPEKIPQAQEQEKPTEQSAPQKTNSSLNKIDLKGVELPPEILTTLKGSKNNGSPTIQQTTTAAPSYTQVNITETNEVGVTT